MGVPDLWNASTSLSFGVAACEGVEEGGVGKVIRKQLDVGREGERGRVVAKPRLHLFRVQSVPKEQRRAGVAERVETDPSSGVPSADWKTKASSGAASRCRQSACANRAERGIVLRPYFESGAWWL